MKEDSVKLQLIDKPEQVKVVDHHPLMTFEFIKVYKDALSYSNMKIDSHLKFRNVSIYEN